MLVKRKFWSTVAAKKQAVRMVTFAVTICTVLSMALSIGPGAIGRSVVSAAACDGPRPMQVGATLEQSPAWRTSMSEWMSFKVEKGQRYQLQVRSPGGLEMGVFDRCDPSAPKVALRNGHLEFTATQDGVYFLQVKRGGLAPASAGYEVAFTAAAPHRPSVAMAQHVPDDLLRRATEFLEELRGSNLAPEWKDARINPEVRILYRPDIEVPAYYEFGVEKPGPLGRGWEPAGYIQLAAGEHDYPVVNWDVTGMSNTQELSEFAPLGANITQFYRLNTLSYTAEYEEVILQGLSVMAESVINLGNLPTRIEGLEALPEEPFELVTEGITNDGKVEYDGPTELPLLEESGWESWNALKAGYEQEYAPLLKSLKQRASDDWELEKNLAEHGETLIKGDLRTVHGLATQVLTKIEVAGAGADPKYLKQDLLAQNTTPTGVTLTVLAEPEDMKTLLPILVTLTYTDATTETVKFAIANRAALNIGNKAFLPVVTGTRAAGASAAAEVQPALSWGPWHYYWADANPAAIAYNQIPSGTWPNTSACWSGCGATAWAMLFAWYDQRAAAGQAPWTGHWGLYRANGGLGTNVVAPNTQDAGVNNMQWEIRGYMGTFCSGSGGSTYYTRMIDAYRYVQPRATASWRMRTRYDPTGLCWFGACNDARNLATDQIVYRRAPAIIGANNHFPMAIGYAWQSETSCFLWSCSTSYNRWFYVNNGWGGASNGWVDWDDVAFAATFNNN